MFKQMSLAVGAVALALFVGSGSFAYAEDQQSGQSNSPAASSGAAATDQQSGVVNGSDQGRRSTRRGRTSDTNTRDNTGMAGSSGTGGASQIDWSDRYRLTPIEHKRLRAMGLNNDEVFAVANAAEQASVDVDDVAQMVLRGRSYFQIAEQLEIPYDSLMNRRPEWQSAEWDREVREGWFTHPQGMSGSGMASDHQSNR